jgi:photosystem II stability/assembly factor-like uncharacterized protein
VSGAALGAMITGASVAAPAGPEHTVNATLIRRPSHTLAPGSKVNASKIFGNRVFTDAKHGFALVQSGEAQYPAATTDGGKTWKTDGPALHLNAAQAPLAVIYIGAASQKTIFAWGTGQVIDTTRDRGKHWYRALFQGLPVAVVKNPRGHLVAFVDGSGSSSSAATAQYVSKNGGKTWRLDNTVGGS